MLGAWLGAAGFRPGGGAPLGGRREGESLVTGVGRAKRFFRGVRGAGRWALGPGEGPGGAGGGKP
ncbi:hypothetical protein GCM10010349_28970 [Streptomyces flavofungini]|nr:hypothetical protein GCM10010349_28970 [Streptomyces flavofungini]